MTHALTRAFGVVSLWTWDARGMTKGWEFQAQRPSSIQSQERGCFIWVDGGSLSEPLNPDLRHLPHQVNYVRTCPSAQDEIDQLLAFQGARDGESLSIPPPAPPLRMHFVVMYRLRPMNSKRTRNTH